MRRMPGRFVPLHADSVEGEVREQSGVPVVVAAKVERPLPGSPHVYTIRPRRAAATETNGATAGE
jgi:hypothetical protein